LRRGRQLKHVYSLGVVISFAGALRYERREPEAARELAEAEIAFAEEHGFRDRLLGDRSLRGWAVTILGQAEQGIADLERAAGSEPSVFQRRARDMLVQAYASVGRTDRALAVVDQALATDALLGAHHSEPELYRLKGEAILSCDSSSTAEAEACLRKAIEIARGQSAKWWELRATASLARLLRDTGHRDEARVMLAEIYHWFTEGFDTGDLKNAKALLDELGA